MKPSVIIFFLLLSYALTARSADFVAQGVLTNAMLIGSSGTAGEYKTSAFRFTATVTNGCWHVSVKSVLHSSPEDTREHIAFYDGTNTHFIDIWHANDTKVREYGETEKGMVMSNGSVVFEPLLWGFGGGTFLKQHRQGDALQYGPKWQAQKAEWETYADQFGALRELRLLSLGKSPGRGKAEFVVFESTKLNGLEIPIKFALETFLPDGKNAATNGMKMVRQAACVVTNVVEIKK